MIIYRRGFLRLAAGAVALPVTSWIASAQAYPARPVTMINPFPAGGPLDTLARMLAERMRSVLGQPVIVENVTGASGSIGTARVARAAPDGHTLGLGYWGTHVANGAIYSLHYDVLNDFEPVAELGSGPLLLIARKDFPASDLPGLIAQVRAQPDVMTLATSGVGTAVHVIGLLFQKETGTRFRFVPYRGVAPAIQDLMAGHVDMMFTDTAVALQHIRAGNVKTFAVTARSRLAGLPDVPTVGELGFPRLSFSQWYGLWASKATPAEIISKINSAVVFGLADAAVRDGLSDQGMDVPAREELAPQALGALQRAEIEKWWPILKAENIRIE